MNTLSSQFTSLVDFWLFYFADDPFVRALQIGVLFGGVLLIFLIFYVTRDILLRTQSLLVMCLCIALVALFPVFGFLLYVLVRPTRTLQERALENMLKQLLAEKQGSKDQVSKKIVRLTKKTERKHSA